MEKLCECGCGNPAPISQCKDGNYLRGEPKRFIRFHHLKIGNKKGPEAHGWRGGINYTKSGIEIYKPDHPQSWYGKYVVEHRLMAERALGRPLPPGVMIHHPNKNRHDNSSLVICQDDAYHKLLHQRTRALESCGHANWRKCYICKKYDDSANLHLFGGCKAYHRSCNNMRSKRMRVLNRKNMAAL